MDQTGLENQGLFGQAILGLSPDIVIDMICFHVESAKVLVEALQGKIYHFLHCGRCGFMAIVWKYLISISKVNDVIPLWSSPFPDEFKQNSPEMEAKK